MFNQLSLVVGSIFLTGNSVGISLMNIQNSFLQIGSIVASQNFLYKSLQTASSIQYGIVISNSQMALSSLTVIYDPKLA